MQTPTIAEDKDDLSASGLKSNHHLTDRQRIGAGLLVLSLIWIIPLLACGSFQPRPTPSPTPDVVEPQVLEAGVAAIAPTDTPSIVIEPTATSTPEPTPTFTPTPVPGTALQVGQPARVIVVGGLNLRETPGAGATLLTQLGEGQRVSVTEGPVAADGYIWWQLDDGQGNIGWAAEGNGTDEWLALQVGTEVQPVSRPPRVGDRVRVTMGTEQQLSVRTTPGTNASIVTRVDSGQEFTVLAGPQSANGFIWYQIRSDNGEIQGWAADGNEESRWLSPLE